MRFDYSPMFVNLTTTLHVFEIALVHTAWLCFYVRKTMAGRNVAIAQHLNQSGESIIYVMGAMQCRTSNLYITHAAIPQMEHLLDHDNFLQGANPIVPHMYIGSIYLDVNGRRTCRRHMPNS